MSKHTMLVRCVHCGTDKPPIRNESELKDIEPWRCSECEISGTTHDFYLLERYKEGFAPDIQPEPIKTLKLEDVEDAVSLLNEAFEKGKQEGMNRIDRPFTNQIREEGRQAGIKEEREATIRYFKRIGKPYYVALFREGEHLK